jgi:hypothetical protein
LNVPAEELCFRRAGVSYRPATAEDGPEIRAILRDVSMESRVTASLERDFFRGLDEIPGRFVPFAARNEKPPHDLIGIYTCHFMPVHVEGKVVYACYLGGLRLRGKYRGRPGILKGGFDSIPVLLPAARTSPLLFTSVAQDNRPARRILEAGLKGMPRYRFLGAMETFAVSVRQGKNHGLLEPAQGSDVRELAAFHNAAAAGRALAPVLDEEWLSRPAITNEPMFRNFLVHRKNGRIAACLSVWDQRPYKRIVIQKYRQPLASLRPAYNLWARFARRQLLPAPGQRLEQVFLAFRAFDASVADREADFIREALLTAEAKFAADSVLFGISPASPGYETLKHALKPYIYETRIESVELRDGAAPLPVHGIVQPEAALL